MKQRGFIKLIFAGVVTIIAIALGYFVFKHQTQSETKKQEVSSTQTQQKTENDSSQHTVTVKPIQNRQDNVEFSTVYPPTPSSFGCNPYSGVYNTHQGKVIQDYEQWRVLYDQLLKGCYTKTKAPQIIDFSKKTMLAVFAGNSCEGTKIKVKEASIVGNKIIVSSIKTIGGCSLPSFSFPFTLISIDKSDFPVEFLFESTQ